jgi:hypothetical protein
MKTKQSFAAQMASYESLLKEAYKPRTIKTYSKVILHFLEWKHSGVPSQKESIEISIREYINPNNSINNRMKDTKSVRAALYLYHYHLTGTKLQSIPETVEKIGNTFVDLEVDAYVSYLREIAGLAEATNLSHRKYLQRLLLYVFPKQEIEPSILFAVTIQSFLAAELRHLKPTSKQVVIGIIRSYFRYLQFKGVKIGPRIACPPLERPSMETFLCS